MKSLKLIKGDLVFDSLGKLVLIEETDLIIQSIELKLKTLKGELFYNENYGIPAFKGKYNEEKIVNMIKEAIMDDERIVDVRINSYKLVYNKLDVNVIIYMSAEKAINYSFAI